MATKAQHFQTEARQTQPNKRTPSRGRHVVDRIPGDDGAQNLTKRGAKNGAVATEESHAGATRKSTRKGNHGGKNSGVLELTAKQKAARPHDRHAHR